MNLNELKELGLSKGEIKIYLALIELGETSIKNIQNKVGIDRRNIYDILDKLITKGYTSFINKKGKKYYQPTHPNKILEEIENKREELEKLENKIPDIKELFLTSKEEIAAEIFRGNNSIKALLEEVLEYKKSFWIGGNSFQNYSSVPKSLEIWFKHWMKKRVEKKHKMHDLVDYGTHLKGLTKENIKKHKSQYYEFWELPKDLSSPMIILIFGNKVAQILWGEQSFAFVLESKEIKNSFMKYFNYFWKKQ